ncbi:M20/M25/M40 family metallo-hydrolase [Arthrobacter sp. PAMC25284]|uniref:M20/M25/M40 family metallo-hydrolase n=1 Tax=Arthrobacter sp. PAMC25284 TaxID=2861279 RepID=UPI002158BB10|nr:M20/M25/M40 family metallo-hydrolase [Arthrobacter sp. PAMC25284]
MIDLTDQRRDAAERLRDGILELAEYRDPDRQGWTREVFSAAYRESRSWVARRMAAAGLQVHEDTAGNIVGRLSGTDPNAPALVTGSHTDSVDGGGRFDGVVGVLGALEAVQLLRESGQPLRRDLLVVDFLGEESNAFGLSCLGSRAIAGELTRADLDRQDYRGVSLGQAYQDFGLDPASVLKTRWARTKQLHAFIELHIEQGPHAGTAPAAAWHSHRHHRHRAAGRDVHRKPRPCRHPADE